MFFSHFSVPYLWFGWLCFFPTYQRLHLYASFNRRLCAWFDVRFLPDVLGSVAYEHDLMIKPTTQGETTCSHLKEHQSKKSPHIFLKAANLMKTIMFLGFTLNFEGLQVGCTDQTAVFRPWHTMHYLKYWKKHQNITHHCSGVLILLKFRQNLQVEDDLVVQPILFWTSNSFQDKKL